MGNDNETTTINVLSLGAGVQSTTLYLKYKDRLDYAIFADTGDEPEDVYTHLEYLKSINEPKILIGSVGTISEDMKTGMNSTGQRFVSVPVFTAPYDGAEKVGMMRRQCTMEYKINVVDRIIRREIVGLKPRQHFPKKKIHINMYFGISIDERRRAESIKARYAKSIPWATPIFPLIDDNMDRVQCRQWLENKVPHRVPRSACVFCPYHSDYEWLRLKKEDPTSWNKAVEVDRCLRVKGNIVNRNMNQKLYLHRSAMPLEEIDFEELAKKPQLEMFNLECEGMCGN